MTARLSDGHQSIGTPKKGYGLARDFSMARYDGFANAFMAARQHAPAGWVTATTPAKRSHTKLTPEQRAARAIKQ